MSLEKILSNGQAAFNMSHTTNTCSDTTLQLFNTTREIHTDEGGQYVWKGVDFAGCYIFAEKKYLDAGSTDSTFRYLFRNRPADVGTYPTEGFIGHITGGPHGGVEYRQPLSNEQITKYELNPFVDEAIFNTEEDTIDCDGGVYLVITGTKNGHLIQFNVMTIGIREKENQRIGYGTVQSYKWFCEPETVIDDATFIDQEEDNKELKTVAQLVKFLQGLEHQDMRIEFAVRAYNKVYPVVYMPFIKDEYDSLPCNGREYRFTGWLPEDDETYTTVMKRRK